MKQENKNWKEIVGCQNAQKAFSISEKNAFQRPKGKWLSLGVKVERKNL